MEKRSERLNVRATPSEKEKLTQLAAAAGMTISAYLLGHALGDALGRRLVDGKEPGNSGKKA